MAPRLSAAYSRAISLVTLNKETERKTERDYWENTIKRMKQERETERERDRESERETERERQRERERDREKRNSDDKVMFDYGRKPKGHEPEKAENLPPSREEQSMKDSIATGDKASSATDRDGVSDMDAGSRLHLMGVVIC